MKILSVLNYPVNNNNKFALSPQEKSSDWQYQYAYNLPCDTVSFGQSDKTDAREANSKKILNLVKNQSFREACDLIEHLDLKEWNPNCVFEDNGHKNCLLGLVIDEFGKNNNGDDKWNGLIDLSVTITSHPDLEIVNSETKQDMLVTAIKAFCPEVAYQLLEADDFINNVKNINLNTYLGCANYMGMKDIVNEIREIQAEQDISTNNGGEDGLSCAALDVRNALSKYEVPMSENDPQSLDDVGGMFQAKKDITEFILKPWDKDFRDRIIANKLNRPSGFLLSGPPGCGKTYIMKAIAAETGYNLYEINLANIGDSSAYKTINEYKTVFDNLEKLYKETGEPSILILDELDSVAMNRKNCNTDWKKDDIIGLLIALNNSAQKGIIVVAATNNPDDLDPAVKRSGRLDKHIKIGLPTADEAKDIIEKILKDREVGAKLLEHSDEIAEKLKGYSPADMSSIIHKTCLNAIYSYKDFADMDDFEEMLEALKREPDDKGRTVIKGFN